MNQERPPGRVAQVWAIVVTTIAAGLILGAYVLASDGENALILLIAGLVAGVAGGVLWVWAWLAGRRQ